MTAEPPKREPRVIRTIVCAFRRDELPADDLQIFRRFEHAMKKAGWAIRVRLEPIERLPEQCDVLVVSPPLREIAERIDRDVLLVVTTRQNAGTAADQLLREIERGDPITADRADPNAPRVVTHRGMEIL